MEPEPQWACPRCTLLNPGRYLVCDVCGLERNGGLEQHGLEQHGLEQGLEHGLEHGPEYDALLSNLKLGLKYDALLSTSAVPATVPHGATVPATVPHGATVPATVSHGAVPHEADVPHEASASAFPPAIPHDAFQDDSRLAISPVSASVSPLPDGKKRKRKRRHAQRRYRFASRSHWHLEPWPVRELDGRPPNTPNKKGLSKEQDWIRDWQEKNHERIRHGAGDIGIPNPAHPFFKGNIHSHPDVPIPSVENDISIPTKDHPAEWAAMRINNTIVPHVKELLSLVRELKKYEGLSEDTSTHGNFHQTWLGLWIRYTGEHVALTKHLIMALRDGSIRPVLTSFIKKLDRCLSRTQQRLGDYDRKTWDRMRFSHRLVSRHINNPTVFRASKRAKNCKESRKFQRERPDLVKTNSFFRMGGMGTVMAVSSGDTGFHYDPKDDAQYYSIIVVLGTDAILDLPELGYRIDIREGDVIALLAGQQLHRLVSTSDDDTMYVITIWTDEATIRLANKTAKEKKKGKKNGNEEDEEHEEEEEWEDVDPEFTSEFDFLHIDNDDPNDPDWNGNDDDGDSDGSDDDYDSDE